MRLELAGATERLGLDAEGERLVYRITHECLANVAKHAAAAGVLVRVVRDGETVVLDVQDDGLGFDVARVLAEPEVGHLGLRVLADLAQEAGATLAVSTAPGRGTWWQLRVRAV